MWIRSTGRSCRFWYLSSSFVVVAVVIMKIFDWHNLKIITLNTVDETPNDFFFRCCLLIWKYLFSFFFRDSKFKIQSIWRLHNDTHTNTNMKTLSIAKQKQKSINNFFLQIDDSSEEIQQTRCMNFKISNAEKLKQIIF